MSWERKKPKQETTLVRLTRQAKALSKLCRRYGDDVARELKKVQGKIDALEGQEATLGEKYTKKRQVLRDAINELTHQHDEIADLEDL